MTAAFEGAQRSRLDPVTLAAFEDSGWYQVNYSTAEQLLWGQGKRQEICWATLPTQVSFGAGSSLELFAPKV